MVPTNIVFNHYTELSRILHFKKPLLVLEENVFGKKKLRSRGTFEFNHYIV